MAYDEGLAERLREVFPEHAGITEKKMFGGLCCLRAATCSSASSARR